MPNKSFRKSFMNTPEPDAGVGLEYKSSEVGKGKRPVFNKPKINDISSPNASTSTIQTSTIPPPRISSTRHSTNKFGFSTQQYKKLQIIKAARQINLKVLMSVNRLKYTKFYFVTLKAFHELIEIVFGKTHVEVIDWQSMVMHMYRHQTRLLVEINQIASLVEKSEFELDQVVKSRRAHFGETPSETSLFKHCMGSKEIRAILQFNFSVYNYVKDFRKKVKPRKVKPTSVKSSASKPVKSNNASLLNSNEIKRNRPNKYTPIKLKNSRSSAKMSNRHKVSKMKNLNSISGSDKKPRPKHNFIGNPSLLTSL
jgi:hypothetical protein